MTVDATSPSVLPVASLQEYFRGALHEALDHRRVAVQDHTEHYVVNLLTLFARAEELTSGSAGRAPHPPLARLLAEALEAPSQEQRCRALQRLGDVSLFVAGFFAGSFARKPIDVDYHIAMGGRAYGSLAESLTRGPRRVLAQVFDELARKFQPLVDVLNEMSEAARPASDHDLLRQYEIWLKTGSPRARDALRELGVVPVKTNLRPQ